MNNESQISARPHSSFLILHSSFIVHSSFVLLNSSFLNMSETALATPHPDVAQSSRATLAGVFVMSFSSLLLELALTRLFSVTLFYHFAFLAISIALLGLGAGGVFAYLRKE